MSKYPSEPFANFIDKIIDFRGRTPKKLGMDWGGGEIRALSANNVEMGKINFEKECYLGSEKLYNKWMNRGDCSESDVVMTMEAPLGNIAQIPDDKKYILSQRTVLFKTKKEKILNDYFYYLLSGDEFQRELQNNATGTTAKGIQQKKLLKIDISAPKSLNKQKKISAILKSVDKCITQTEETISKLQKIKTGLMQDLFTRGVDANGKLRPSYDEKPELYKSSPLGMIPKEWDCPKIVDIKVCLIDGDRGPNYPKSDDLKASGYCLFLNAGNVTQSGYDFSECQFITKEKDNVLRKGKVLKGDIVLTTRGTVGNMAITSIDTPFENIRINSGMIILRNEEKRLKTDFLYHSLDKYIFQKEFIKLVSGSAQPQLPVADFKKFPVLIPGEIEQDEILKKINSFSATLDEEFKFLRKLQKAKNGLMQDLLTGKVEVKVDKDE
nr:restriction endonuclease subunit S [Bacteriovorax sp. HI3]